MSSYWYSVKWAPNPINDVLIKRENLNRHMYTGKIPSEQEERNWNDEADAK